MAKLSDSGFNCLPMKRDVDYARPVVVDACPQCLRPEGPETVGIANDTLARIGGDDRDTAPVGGVGDLIWNKVSIKSGALADDENHVL